MLNSPGGTLCVNKSVTQKIKQMNVIGNEGSEEDRKEAILGTLTLYLDFINLFLLLLRPQKQ